MPAVVQGRPSLSQEPEIPFRSPMWVAGMYHLVVSRMRLTGSWKRSRVKSSSQALLNWMQDPQRAAEPSILLCLALHVISKLKKIYIYVCVCMCVFYWNVNSLSDSFDMFMDRIMVWSVFLLTGLLCVYPYPGPVTHGSSSCTVILLFLEFLRNVCPYRWLCLASFFHLT